MKKTFFSKIRKQKLLTKIIKKDKSLKEKLVMTTMKKKKVNTTMKMKKKTKMLLQKRIAFELK